MKKERVFGALDFVFGYNEVHWGVHHHHHNNNICFCRSNLQTNSILGIIGISLLSCHRGRSEPHHCGPEAAAERHGGDLVVPVGLGHAGVAEAGEVIAAAAPSRSHAPLLEVLFVPVIAASVRYSLKIGFNASSNRTIEIR